MGPGSLNCLKCIYNEVCLQILEIVCECPVKIFPSEVVQSVIIMDTVKSHLEILSENSQGNVNYVSWKFKLNLTLKLKDLFLVATGIKVKPTGSDTPTEVVQWTKQNLKHKLLLV